MTVDKSDRDAWLAATTAEYNSLREESLRSIDRQHTILRLATTVLGVLIATGRAKNDDVGFAAPLLILITPGVALASFVLWLGEVERMVRAGNYISKLEARVNLHFEGTLGQAMGWENSLRPQVTKDGRTVPVVRVISSYRPIPMIFIGFVGGACLFGYELAHPSHVAWAIAAVVAGVGFPLYLAGYYAHTAHRLRKMGGLPEGGGLFLWCVRHLLEIWSKRVVVPSTKLRDRVLERLTGSDRS